MDNQNIKVTIDVNAIDPLLRQQLIFNTFNQLLPGEALLLIDGHDSKPLYQQLRKEFGELFTWTDEERGPLVWRTRIGRVAACCA